MEKNKVSIPVILLTLLLLVIGAVIILNLNKPLTDTLEAVVPGTDLNSSDDSTFGVNPDDTMGPGSWQGNYSNILPGSVKGNLAFYVTDPPGSPPGLEKKKQPTDVVKPTAKITRGAAQNFASPTSTFFLPGKDAQLTALLLTINKVEVHRAGSLSSPSPTVTPAKENRWETLYIGTAPKTVDLIDLANKKLDLLFETTKLEAGRYTEVRLYVSSGLAKYSDGAQVNLQILGKKKIVKIVRQFTIVAGETTKLTVDFNARRSVVRAGNKFILKPVVARMLISGPLAGTPMPIISPTIILTPIIIQSPTVLQ